LIDDELQQHGVRVAALGLRPCDEGAEAEQQDEEIAERVERLPDRVAADRARVARRKAQLKHVRKDPGAERDVEGRGDQPGVVESGVGLQSWKAPDARVQVLHAAVDVEHRGSPDLLRDGDAQQDDERDHQDILDAGGERRRAQSRQVHECEHHRRGEDGRLRRSERGAERDAKHERECRELDLHVHDERGDPGEADDHA